MNARTEYQIAYKTMRTFFNILRSDNSTATYERAKSFLKDATQHPSPNINAWSNGAKSYHERSNYEYLQQYPERRLTPIKRKSITHDEIPF